MLKKVLHAQLFRIRYNASIGRMYRRKQTEIVYQYRISMPMRKILYPYLAFQKLTLSLHFWTCPFVGGINGEAKATAQLASLGVVPDGERGTPPVKNGAGHKWGSDPQTMNQHC